MNHLFCGEHAPGRGTNAPFFENVMDMHPSRIAPKTRGTCPNILDHSYSMSLAGNNKFIAAVTRDAIMFLDTSTLATVGIAIEGEWSSGISLDSSRVATGRVDGKIVIHDLTNLLPEFYGPFEVSTCPFIILACLVNTIPCIRHQPTRNDNQTRNL